MDIRICEVVLASASPRRKEILSNAGIRFTAIPAEGEEIRNTTEPVALVKKLSMDKASEVAGRCGKELLVIGADTVVAVDGEILGKPADEAEAMTMLTKLQGRTHSVYTGVTLLYKGVFGDTVEQFAEETKVHVLPMSKEEIERYIRTDEPMDKAGAYGIQGRFAEYVSGIEGDYLNVVGLPLSRLVAEVKKLENL